MRDDVVQAAPAVPGNRGRCAYLLTQRGVDLPGAGQSAGRPGDGPLVVLYQIARQSRRTLCRIGDRLRCRSQRRIGRRRSARQGAEQCARPLHGRRAQAAISSMATA
jgi:hypothetical protein